MLRTVITSLFCHLVILLLPIPATAISAPVTPNANSTALMMSTLFTFQDHACEKEKLRLRCPYGTTIYLQWAHFGRMISSHQLCPSTDLIDAMSGINSTKKIHIDEDTNCISRPAFQVMFDECQDKRVCTMRATARQFNDDPCPGTSKYLEAAYKCRPNEFQNRVTCEKEEMELTCKKSKRIVIYSAVFGWSNHGNSCRQPPAYSWSPQRAEGDCSSDCALRVAMESCHGKRSCRLSVTEDKFGSPCKEGVTKSLSVLFTCVTKRIIKEINENPGDPHPQRFCKHLPRTTTETTTRKQRHRTSTFIPNYTVPYKPHQSSTLDPFLNVGPNQDLDENGNRNDWGMEGNNKAPVTYDYSDMFTIKENTQNEWEIPDSKMCQNGETSQDGYPCATARPVESSGDEQTYIGFIHDWVNTFDFIKGNQEKFILYLIIGLFSGLILVLLVIIIRLLQTRRKRDRQGQLDISESVASTNGGVSRFPTNGSAQRASRMHDEYSIYDNADMEGVDILGVSRPPPIRSDYATGPRHTTNNYG